MSTLPLAAFHILEVFNGSEMPLRPHLFSMFSFNAREWRRGFQASNCRIVPSASHPNTSYDPKTAQCLSIPPSAKTTMWLTPAKGLLQAVLKEALRLSYGFMRRLPRVSPDVAIQYKEYTIPPGTPVGMGAYLMHSNPEVYQDPDQFIPERWLAEDTKAMQKSYVPFTRGSRSCLGQNLSMAEISLVLAVLFRSNGLGMELFETDESDVKHIHDFVVPLPKLDSLGVRVMVR
ncbi:cytochrome P450 [Pseudoneurospora amorphoporcata]|uniref:Cytochrome P450 n=1 Tax=Pseudoneurospora amorphoporcata TaxID=241081 RepID=A0AAN6NRS3_9PEZI|nr:cytochrome P450 [Pseudoneurospora amorphoporcata]